MRAQAEDRRRAGSPARCVSGCSAASSSRARRCPSPASPRSTTSAGCRRETPCRCWPTRGWWTSGPPPPSCAAVDRGAAGAVRAARGRRAGADPDRGAERRAGRGRPDDGADRVMESGPPPVEWLERQRGSTRSSTPAPTARDDRAHRAAQATDRPLPVPARRGVRRHSTTSTRSTGRSSRGPGGDAAGAGADARCTSPPPTSSSCATCWTTSTCPWVTERATGQPSRGDLCRDSFCVACHSRRAWPIAGAGGLARPAQPSLVAAIARPRGVGGR